MSERYWRCKKCSEVLQRSGRCPNYACWDMLDDMEPVEVVPAGTVARLREALKECEETLDYATEEVGIGWYALPRVRAALAATEEATR